MPHHASSLAKQKLALRAQLLQLRQNFTAAAREACNAPLIALLATWLKQRDVVQVFSFLPVRGEPDLRPLQLRTELGHLYFGLPAIDSHKAGTMQFYRWQGGDPLAPNRFGILEPDVVNAQLLAPDAKTCILVPCLAATKTGIRLGYGGGYYDRYLKGGSATTVGIVHSAYLRPSLPHGAHDVRLDYVATELGIDRTAAASP